MDFEETMNLLEEEENYDSFYFEDFFSLSIERRKNIIFKVNIKRGRYNLSNIKRKIKSHFIRFLIEFCNDALKEENLKIPNFLINNKFLLPCMYILKKKKLKIY